jgi:hypothetical protein
MKPAPRVLLEQMQRIAAPTAEVVPLEWAYEATTITPQRSSRTGTIAGCWKITCWMPSWTPIRRTEPLRRA